MDFFGIGLLEVLAVFLLMAIVFGPQRLPEIAAQFGRAIRELREYARDFRDEYLTDFEEVKEEYLEIRHELEATDSEFRQEMKELDEDLRATVRDAEADAVAAVKGAESAARGDAADASAPATTTAAAPTSAADAVDGAAANTPPQPAQGKQRRRFNRAAARGGKNSPARPANVISINRQRSRRP